ncbi:MAG: hypothetical protein JNK82_28910 [Myxococcaceae bacterium]|nr:hypothetical protein [Myxococcaceae bacterium]
MNPALTVGGIIQNGLKTGLKNATGLLGAVALWAVTAWVPYLNVGTTIGLLGLVAAMSRGEPIRPIEIFNPKYRDRMGEFFLVIAFVSIGVLVGFMFVGIPGVVIGLTWSLAPLLVIDQGLNPSEALTRSNELTSGKKVTLFFGLFLTNFAVTAVVMFIARLGGLLHGFIGLVFALAGYVLLIAVAMGANAFVYGTLNRTWPSEPDRFPNQGPVVGATIGAALLSLALLAGVNALHRHIVMSRFEDEWKSRRSEYDAPPRYAPPAEPARVAPSLRDEPEPPVQKNVASSKTRAKKR